MGWEMHFAVVERDAKYCEKNTIYRKRLYLVILLEFRDRDVIFSTITCKYYKYNLQQ